MENEFCPNRKKKEKLKHWIFILALSFVYLVISFFLIGFKPEQIFLVLFCSVLYLASSGTRKFITAFSVFVFFWIIFDYMKAFPNYQYNSVHIKSLYEAEKSVFGFCVNGVKLTPNEYFLMNGSTFLNIITGVFYLCWVPVPLGFAAYLFFYKKDYFFKFSLTFLLVNIIGFIIYYVYPAAPPWYVALHPDFRFIAHTSGNTAGLGRFDHYFHVGIFKSLYSESSNVFAAMPSLHSAYPLVVFYYGLKVKVKKSVISIFALIALGIWFSAIYNGHHYVFDVLFGICCAITGIFLFWLLSEKSAKFKNFLNKATQAIS